LKTVAVAMLNYHNRNGTLPPAAIYSKEGQPLLSWRVLVLPDFGKADLYQQFHLGEPWDSPHNKKLLATMPNQYAPFDGNAPPQPYTTFYQVFVGRETAFTGLQGLRLPADFPDAISTTFLVVEAGEAVPWTKPADLTYASDQPLPRLGGISKDRFRVALADCSLRTLPQETPEETIRAAITRNGGEKVELGPWSD
jgi:hypothetical protein